MDNRKQGFSASAPLTLPLVSSPWWGAVLGHVGG